MIFDDIMKIKDCNDINFNSNKSYKNIYNSILNPSFIQVVKYRNLNEMFKIYQQKLFGISFHHPCME